MIQNIVNTLHSFAAACRPGGGGINEALLPTWYKYLETRATARGCEISFTVSSKDIGAILLAIIEILLRLGAIVAVFFVIWGGIQYVLSQGSPDKTKDAKDTIVNALIGVVLVMLATVIVNFIGNTLI